MFYQENWFISNMIQMILECNDIVMNIYNSDFDVEYKEDQSPLTMADQKCNEHILKYLDKTEIPVDYQIISEETKNFEYLQRKSAKWIFLIDPIDGTKEFVKKNGEFTINVGLCFNGVPVFGIVSIPVQQTIFYGMKGIGSFKLYKNSIQTLKIEQNKNLEKEGIRIVASKSHNNQETQDFISQFKNPEILSAGSSIKLLMIAENKADIYPRLGLTSEWDTCAAHAIVKYAGGTVLQHVSGKTLNKEVEYNKKNLLNPYFIVY